MKKIILYFGMMAAVVACYPVEVDSDLSQNGNGMALKGEMITETVSGTYGSSTKATIADTDASFKWSVGDNIAVHVSNGNTHKYVFTSDQGASGASQAAASASFTVTYEAGYSRDAFAVYPSTIVAADAANYGQSGTSLDVTLPSSYTLAQVTGETSPCPMIASNTSEPGWTFYQLCSLLRLTVNNIPAAAKRLEIDFDGKKVWGDFSIASGVTPSTSVITSTADDDHDIITITNDGTDVVLGETSLVLNIPLPVGTYSSISIYAYDALTGGSSVMEGTEAFAYDAVNTKGVKKSVALSSPPSGYNFTFKNGTTTLDNIRFVRIFSSQNKLKNGETTYGPFTVYSNTNLDSPFNADISFDENLGDQIIYQLFDSDGKAYSGSTDALSSYEVIVNVHLDVFTVNNNTGKKVCFSPGDYGKNNTFSEPFVGVGDTDYYYTYSTAPTTKIVAGVTWRIPDDGVGDDYDMTYILNSRTMPDGVSRSYRVYINKSITIGTVTTDPVCCLLLPPDGIILTDAEKTELSNAGNSATPLTDYLKYIGKGFVLLTRTGRYDNGWKSATLGGNDGWYRLRQDKRCLRFGPSQAQSVGTFSNLLGTNNKARVRYIHTITTE